MLAVLSSSRCPQSLLFSSWVSEECVTQQCSYLSSFTKPWRDNLYTRSKIPQLLGRRWRNLQDFFWLSFKVNSLLCSTVNYFSWARVQFVYLSSAQSGFFANCEIWSDDLRPDVFVLQVGGYPGHNSTELWFPPSSHHNRRSFSSSSTLTPCNLPDLPKPTYYPTERLNVKHIWQLSFAGVLKYHFLGAGK